MNKILTLLMLTIAQLSFAGSPFTETHGEHEKAGKYLYFEAGYDYLYKPEHSLDRLPLLYKELGLPLPNTTNTKYLYQWCPIANFAYLNVYYRNEYCILSYTFYVDYIKYPDTSVYKSIAQKEFNEIRKILLLK